MRMEYTTIESFLLSLPIINRRFAENAYSPDGKLWGDYYGPLVSTIGEEEQLAEEVIKISENKGEWEDRTQACKELVIKFNNIDNLAPQFLSRVLAMGHRKDKSDPLSLMAKWFPNALSHRQNGEILMSNTNSILKSNKMILDKNKQKILK